MLDAVQTLIGFGNQAPPKGLDSLLLPVLIYNKNGYFSMAAGFTEKGMPDTVLIPSF